MNEIWIDIVGYEGYYQVSDLGNIRSIDRIINHPSKGAMRRKSKMLSPAPNGKGYLTVVLCKNGINKTLVVHRIVAKCWIPNPHNNIQVNHINGEKRDNKIINLEWCDNSYNMNHAISIGLFDNKVKGNMKPIILIKDNITISFKSGKMAATYINTSSGAIGNVLNGTRNKIKGYSVQYL